MNKTLIFPLAALAVAMASCTCHHFDEPVEVPAPAMKAGHVLCTDGGVLPICQFFASDKEAVGIVFWVNPDVNAAIKGYAVYLHDIAPEAFSEELTVSQGTSCDVNGLDGNENTYALYNNANVSSPMAHAVFDMWKYGQSAYVPSVRQARLLFEAKGSINDRIVYCGGEAIPDDADECWYWTSTEVDGQSEAKAWLISLYSGVIQETPKTQPHKVRPIITIQ